MVQLVYVLELVKGTQHVRVHFAQAPKAAKRAVSHHGLSGVWQDLAEGPVVALLLSGDQVVARVVREEVEYS